MSVYQRGSTWEYCVTIKRQGRILARERKGGFASKRATIAAEAEARARMLAEPQREPGHALTFAELAQRVLVLHAGPHNKASETASKRSIFERHLVPAFGEMKLEDIGPKQIAEYTATKEKAG